MGRLEPQRGPWRPSDVFFTLRNKNSDEKRPLFVCNFAGWLGQRSADRKSFGRRGGMQTDGFKGSGSPEPPKKLGFGPQFEIWGIGWAVWSFNVALGGPATYFAY